MHCRSIIIAVSTYARGLPFGFHHGNSPQRLDTPDDQDVAGAAAAGQAGQAQTGGQVNEVGDTPDDQDEFAAGQGANPQGQTTIAPLSPGGGGGGGGGDSSGSSEEGSDVAYPAGPSPGPVGGQAIDTNNIDSGEVINAQGVPMFNNAAEQAAVAVAGDSSGNVPANAAAPGEPSPLKVHQEHAESQGRKSGALIAITTLGLVAMVVATSFVAYKYKDAISARLGM